MWRCVDFLRHVTLCRFLRAENRTLQISCTTDRVPFSPQYLSPIFTLATTHQYQFSSSVFLSLSDVRPSFIFVKSTKHVSITVIHYRLWSTQLFQDIFYQLLHPFLFMVYIYCIIYRTNVSNWVAYLTAWHGTTFSTKLCMRIGISLNISP
jgi:hypothetical protein